MNELVAAIRPTIARTFETQTINWKGGALTVSVMRLPCGILVQRENAMWEHPTGKAVSFKIRGGTVWVPNAELASRTAGRSRYMRCADLYDAFRQTVHTQSQYGVASAHRGSEASRVNRQIEDARISARMMQRRTRLKVRVRAASDALQWLIVADLGNARDEHKRNAAQLFMKSFSTAARDALGRPNSTAAAMQVYAGMGELMKRVCAMALTNSRIETREEVIGAMIVESLSAFNQLWADLATTQSARITQLIHLIERGTSDAATPDERLRARQMFTALAEMFRAHHDRLSCIHAAPFRRNAYHTLQDLRSAEAACASLDVVQLRACVARMKHGMRWVYPLNALHVEILLPLTMRLEHQRLLCKLKNMDVPRAAYRMTFSEYLAHEHVSDHFRPLVDDIASFAMRVEKLADNDLLVPVKARVKRHLARALMVADKKDWIQVRLALKSIAQEIL